MPALSSPLQRRDGWAAAGGGDTAGLERAAVEAGAIVVLPAAEDLAAPDDDAAVPVVEGGFAGLLEAEGEVGVGAWRHCWLEVLSFGCLVRDWCNCLSQLTVESEVCSPLLSFRWMRGGCCSM